MVTKSIQLGNRLKSLFLSDSLKYASDNLNNKKVLNHFIQIDTILLKLVLF